MTPKRKSYYNVKWHAFSKSIKKRDDSTCLKCGRKEPHVILQAHHKIYKPGLEPWEYPLSDCITLCKGCHSRVHGLVEPESGWTLISIEDLGDLSGICERKGCGSGIRYEHVIYHPQWGYKSVGSTCVEYLTKEDQYISHEIIGTLKKISDFVKLSSWENKTTQKGKHFQVTTYAHSKIRIYGTDHYYSFQIALKLKGEKMLNWQKIISAKNKTLGQVKELGFIVLKGLTAENNRKKELLRNIYRNSIK